MKTQNSALPKTNLFPKSLTFNPKTYNLFLPIFWFLAIIPFTLCSVWGNGILEPPEQWDDGNQIDGDDCSSLCLYEVDLRPVPGLESEDQPLDTCGDGVVNNRYKVGPRLSCDDGNFLDGDGWSSTWLTEIGYICFGGDFEREDECHELCGDGLVMGKKSDPTYCDDMNSKSGDGCDHFCRVEPGYVCSGGNETSRSVWHREWTVENWAQWYTGDEHMKWAVCSSSFSPTEDGKCQKSSDILMVGTLYEHLGYISVGISGAAIALAIGLSFLTKSSPTLVWIIVNQYQLLSLFMLMNTAISHDILAFLEKHNFYSLSMKFLSLTNSLNLEVDGIGKEQSDQSLSYFGLEYESSTMNSLGIFFALVILVVIHTVISFIPRKPSERIRMSVSNKLNNLIIKIFRAFTFGVYIRFILQAFQYLSISVLSEFKNFNTSSGSSIPSLILNTSYFLLLSTFLTLSFYHSFRSLPPPQAQTSRLREFTSSLKPSTLAQLHTPTLLLKKVLLITLLLFIPASYPYTRLTSVLILQTGYLLISLKTRPYSQKFDCILEFITEGIFTLLALFTVKMGFSYEWGTGVNLIFTGVILASGWLVLVLVIGKIYVWLYRLWDCEDQRGVYW